MRLGRSVARHEIRGAVATLIERQSCENAERRERKGISSQMSLSDVIAIAETKSFAPDNFHLHVNKLALAMPSGRPVCFTFSLLLVLGFLQLSLALLCYECNTCIDLTSCTCTNSSEVDAQTSYCTLTRENSAGSINYYVTHVPRNVTTYEIYDPNYVSVRETISYDPTVQLWLSTSNEMTYACHTDKCNRGELLREFSDKGLSLSLPTDWLNEKLQRKPGASTTRCRQCPDGVVCGNTEDEIDPSKCNIDECEASCLMDKVTSQAETSQFCYQSFCSDDTAIGPEMSSPKVDITAVYYIRKKQLEIVEVAVTCNALDCSQLNIFQDIKDKLEKDLGGIQALLTANKAPSMHSTFLPVLSMILFQLKIFH